MRIQHWNRKRKLLRIKAMISIGIFFATALAVFLFSGISSQARSKDYVQEYKYYQCYEVRNGDTLWSIAESGDNDHFNSTEAHISEICMINSIDADTTLYEGMNLIIPYYSSEFK